MFVHRFLIVAYALLLLGGVAGGVWLGTALFNEKKQWQERFTLLEQEVVQLQEQGLVVNAVPDPSSNTATVPSELQNLKTRVSLLEQGKKAPSTSPVQVVQQKDGVKEATLFLGSGTTVNRDWTVISGAVGKVNTTHYGKIKAVYFEAGMSIISGEVHARLVNKSTGQPFFTSELSHNSSTATWKQSPPLQLPAGEAEYTVQLRSSNGEQAVLDGARIRIIVE